MAKKLSRTQHSALNLAVSSVAQIVSFGLSFVARIVFIKVLGVEILGINALFESILVALSLLDLGLGSAVAYSFYQPLADNDQAKIVNLLAFYAKIYRFLAGLFFVGGLVVVPFLPTITKTSIPLADLTVYYLLLLLATSSSYLFVYKATLITADQKTYVVKIHSTLFAVLRTAAQLVALLMWRDYKAWLIIHLISVVGMNLALAWKAHKLYPYLNQAPQPLSKTERREISRNVKSLFLYRISGVVINTSDNVIGSMIVGAAKIGIYSNYYMIIGTIGTFFQALLASLTASIGNLSLSKNKQNQYQVFRAVNFLTFWSVGVVVVWLSLSLNHIISLWLGEKMLFANWIMWVIVANFYFQTTAAPLWLFRDGYGTFHQVKNIGIYMAIVNIVLSVVLGLWLGIGGVLLATLVSRLTTVYWLEPWLLHKIIFKRSYSQYLRMRLKYALVIVVSLIGSWLISDWLIIRGLWQVLEQLIISAIITSGLFFGLFWQTKEVRLLLDKIIVLLEAKANKY